jgi:environmental stress-induced protein Ves
VRSRTFAPLERPPTRFHNRAVSITLIPANEYRRERWKNGLGWTREIVREPAGDAAWDWRLSIAEVEKNGAFSTFPGCDRELVLLTGEGMRLAFEDGECVTLEPPHARHRFAGERPLSAELIAGPTHDFNVIWRRQAVDVAVLHRPLVGAMVFFPEAGVRWLVHLLSGQAMFKDQPVPLRLATGDSALLEIAEGGDRTILDGGGEVLLVRISDPPQG